MLVTNDRLSGLLEETANKTVEYYDARLGNVDRARTSVDDGCNQAHD